MRAQQFQAIVQQAADGILVVDADGVVLFANPASEVLLDRGAAELIGTSLGQPIVVDGSTELAILRKNGDLVTVEMRAAEIVWDGAPAVLASMRDISQRVRTSAQLEHVNSVLRAVRTVNQLIVREKSRDRLLERATEMLVETRGYTSALCVHLDDHQQVDFVAHGVAARETTQASKDAIRSNGLTACMKQALKRNEIVVLENDAPECSGCPLASYYPNERRLVRSLVHDGQAHGVLIVTLPDALKSDPEELELLEEMSGDLAFALHSMKADEDRREAEDRFRVSFEQSSIGKSLTSVDERFLRVNQALASMLGYRVDEFEGRSLCDFTFPEDLAKGRQAVRALVGGAAAQRFEQRHLCKDGSVVWVDASIASVRNATGEVQYFVADLVDVTERKRAEEALRTFALAVGASSDAIGMSTPDGRHHYQNEAFTDLFGYIGASPPDSVYVDKAVGREIFATIGQGTPWTGDVEMIGRAGDVLHVSLRAYPIKDDSGKILGLVGIHTNITERKRAAEALETSEKRYRRLFEAAKDGILILDADTGKIVDVNPFMTALTGYSHENFVDKYLWEIGPFKDVIASKSAFAELQRKGYVRYDNLPLKCSDGRKVDVEFVSNVYVVDHHNIIQCNIRDVTEMKLMRVQIAQSDRLATMGMLAAGVAHEINNPLAYVLYNLESLTDDLPRLFSALRKCLGIMTGRIGNEEWAQLMGKDQELLNPALLDDIRARFEDALQGSHRIRDVARGLGTFSRVERERMVPVTLRHVIEVAINMAFNEIKYRARLVKEYGQTSTILGNDGRLSQVFLNLLINASHSITEGDLERNEIRVRTWQEADEVFAEVRDTGTGIAKEHLPRLFEPFFTTKEPGTGTGLGLSISKTIVEEHGGRIEVESEVGKGTRFVVRLPVKKAEDLDEGLPATEALAQPEVRGRILVVDDEAEIRSAMVRMLRGHDVVQAVSGEEAQKILEADHAFDLILCDMMMPAMSGVELHEWLSKAHPDLAKQVVFITGGAFTPKAREHLSKVSNIRIEKPFDVANFKKIVAELIVARRNRGS